MNSTDVELLIMMEQMALQMKRIEERSGSGSDIEIKKKLLWYHHGHG
jgi:hypothetical protein